MAIAISPLVMDAKHIFRPLAEPIVSATRVIFNSIASLASILCKPETTRPGFDQLLSD